MRVLLYELRHRGCPLSYSQVMLRAPLIGQLVYEQGEGRTMRATLLRKGRPATELRAARIVRISNGCMLIKGVEPGHRPPPQQTWLCASDPESGKAAIRQLRPPTGNEPFSEFEDDESPLDRA